MTKKRTKQRAPLGNFRLEELGIDVQHVPSDGDTPVDADVLAEIGYHKFDRCPICLGSGPMTNEDVPPQSIGVSLVNRSGPTCRHWFWLHRCVLGWCVWWG